MSRPPSRVEESEAYSVHGIFARGAKRLYHALGGRKLLKTELLDA